MSRSSHRQIISANALRALHEARSALDAVLEEFDPRYELATAQPESKRMAAYRRRWPLLRDVQRKGGEVSRDEWRELGRKHGYDPRALGGLFHGDALMEVDGDRRRLTAEGDRWVNRWAAELGEEGPEGSRA